MRGYQAGMCGSDLASTCGADVPEPVEIRKSLFFNPDSIAYYSAIAASLDEADHYLLRAAELGNPDAIKYIKCCEYHGTWKHFVPSANN